MKSVDYRLAEIQVSEIPIIKLPDLNLCFILFHCVCVCVTSFCFIPSWTHGTFGSFPRVFTLQEFVTNVGRELCIESLDLGGRFSVSAEPLKWEGTENRIEPLIILKPLLTQANGTKQMGQTFVPKTSFLSKLDVSSGYTEKFFVFGGGAVAFLHKMPWLGLTVSALQ